MGDYGSPENPPHSGGEWSTFFRTGGMAAVQRAMEGEAPVLAPYDIPDGYRIVRLLGEGGMGAVYLAQRSGEEDIGQLALKLIHPWLLGMTGFRERFARERQALAVLEGHPHILHLKDAGTTRQGIPFLATDYVEGEPVTRYCDRKKLSIDDRLHLFIKICDAVRYAHLRLIVHSDITPRNILIKEDGTPKLLDFGLARLLAGEYGVDSTTMMPGRRPLTPAYASPEQVMGLPVMIPSDVYQLGVILYELLAGTSPYVGKGDQPERVLQAVCEVNPPRASEATSGAIEGFGKDMDPKRRKRRLRGDLDKILSMSLRKDPQERYGSVERFADDIGRYLRNERVMAMPPSPGYRARKFVRRYRTALSITAAFVLVLMGASVFSLGQSIRARRAAAVAEAVNSFLRNDLLAQASAHAQAKPDVTPDPHLEVRTALDRAAARIATKFEGQPEVEAAIRDTIGQTYVDLGLYPEAQIHLNRALELDRQMLGENNPATLRLQRRLGAIFQLEQKFAEAESLLSRTLQLQRRALGPEHSDTLDSMNSLATVYFFQGKYSEAVALYRQTLEIQSRVLGPAHSDSLITMNNLTNAYLRQGNYVEAEKIGSRTLQIKRRVLGREHPDTLNSMNGLAVAYMEQGKYAEAERLNAETLEIKRRGLGSDHPDTLASMNNLANALYLEGKYAAAETMHRQTLEIKQRVLGAENLDTVATINNLADACYQQGKFTEAEALFKQAIAISSRKAGIESPYTLAFLSDMAGMYQRQGRYDQAEKAASQTLAAEQKLQGPDSPDTIDATMDVSLSYESQGKFAQSEPLARRAYEFNLKNRPDDWRRFRAESLLGTSLAGQERYAEAEPLLIEGYQGMAARKARTAVPEWYHLQVAGYSIVRLYEGWGKPAKVAEWKTTLSSR